MKTASDSIVVRVYVPRRGVQAVDWLAYEATSRQAMTVGKAHAVGSALAPITVFYHFECFARISTHNTIKYTVYPSTVTVLQKLVFSRKLDVESMLASIRGVCGTRVLEETGWRET